MLVALTGICRFEILHELDVATAYRQCAVTFDGFAADLVAGNQAWAVNRDALITAFRQYLEANNMGAEAYYGLEDNQQLAQQARSAGMGAEANRFQSEAEYDFMGKRTKGGY